jgi:hypothetical protein
MTYRKKWSQNNNPTGHSSIIPLLNMWKQRPNEKNDHKIIRIKKNQSRPTWATWRCESDMWVPQPHGHADPQPHGHVGPIWRGPRALPTSTWVPPVPLAIPPYGPHHHHTDSHMASHAATQTQNHVANRVPTTKWHRGSHVTWTPLPSHCHVGTAGPTCGPTM